ncbi:MAG: hypothetical protein EZS28_035908, partial [Streblomastix strix]
ELKIRAKAVIVRYDNPLTIAYSQELDDSDLVGLTIDIFKNAQDPAVIHLIRDITSILILRRIVQVLLDFDDFRKMVEQTSTDLISTVIQFINMYAKEKECICACLRVLHLSLGNSAPLLEMLLNDTECCDYILSSVKLCQDHLGIAVSGSNVICEMCNSVKGRDYLMNNRVLSTVTELLERHCTEELVVLPVVHIIKKLIAFRKARQEIAGNGSLAQVLVRAINRHMTGLPSIVQFAFMSLVFMSLSSECRESCRDAHVEVVMAKSIDAYATNPLIVKNGCIALSQLIFNSNLIDRFITNNIAKSLVKAQRAMIEQEDQMMISLKNQIALYHQHITHSQASKTPNANSPVAAIGGANSSSYPYSLQPQQQTLQNSLSQPLIQTLVSPTAIFNVLQPIADTQSQQQQNMDLQTTFSPLAMRNISVTTFTHLNVSPIKGLPSSPENQN